jgi:hypothetical protein
LTSGFLFLLSNRRACPSARAPRFWLGYHNPSQNARGGTHASNFVWANGEAVSFTYWGSGEPNNTGGTEFYAAMRSIGYYPAGSWNDLPDSAGGDAGIIFGVVEVVPGPQSATLLLLGLGAALQFRNKKKLQN